MKKSQVIIQGMITAVLFLLLFLSLSISSNKVRIVFSILGIGAFVLAKSKKINIKILIISVMIVFFLLNGIYNYRNMSIVLPMEQTTNQTLYQLSDYENKIYPDSFLRLLLSEKKVVIPYELKPYSEYSSYGKDDLEGNPFSNQYYIENNYARYLMTFANAYTVDEKLPKVETVNMELYQDDFYNFGGTNDMLRYSFLLNQEGIQESSYFWYSWYYFTFAQEREQYGFVYINMDGITEEDVVVAIWDKNENLFLMPMSYYEKEVANG
ncbi:MAG: hypothetical protein PHY47_01620 [Lachnospiraceae bacterium]|nr:hypothetical protein [Lachnospiraceae bacterium]